MLPLRRIQLARCYLILPSFINGCRSSFHGDVKRALEAERVAPTWTRPAGRAPFEGFALEFGSFNVNVLEGPAEAAEQHAGGGGSVAGKDRI